MSIHLSFKLVKQSSYAVRVTVIRWRKMRLMTLKSGAIFVEDLILPLGALLSGAKSSKECSPKSCFLLRAIHKPESYFF